jgi:hypothetical protein
MGDVLPLNYSDLLKPQDSNLDSRIQSPLSFPLNDASKHDHIARFAFAGAPIIDATTQRAG